MHERGGLRAVAATASAACRTYVAWIADDGAVHVATRGEKPWTESDPPIPPSPGTSSSRTT